MIIYRYIVYKYMYIKYIYIYLRDSFEAPVPSSEIIQIFKIK